jgi:hypothetical protein
MPIGVLSLIFAFGLLKLGHKSVYIFILAIHDQMI